MIKRNNIIEKDIKIISDLWYEFQGEIDYLNIMIDDREQEQLLIQISMTYDEYNSKYQEGLYNFCLEIAHDLGYYLEGEMEEYKNDNTD